MKDVAGNDIRRGSIVLYSVTVGQTARLRFGVVHKVTGGRDNRVTINGYSKNYDGEGWHSRKGSIAWCNLKCMVIPDHVIPGDIHDQLTNESDELLES